MTLIRFFTLSFVVGFAAREADAQSCQALESRANASVQLVQDGEDSPGLTILLPDCVADDRATSLYGGTYRKLCIGGSLQSLMKVVRPEHPGIGVCIARALTKANVLSDCHGIAHSVGEHLWTAAVGSDMPLTREAIVNASAVLNKCPSGCIKGCTHAVLTGIVTATYAMHQGDETGTRAMLRAVCSGVASNSVQGCDSHLFNHGVGHGFGALATNPTTATVVGGVEGALDMCNSAPIPSECQGAVLMEFVDYNLDGVLGVGEPDPELVDTVCSPFENNETLLADCGNVIGEGLMFVTCHNLRQAQTVCKKVTSESQCLEGADDEADTASSSALSAAHFASCVAEASGMTADDTTSSTVNSLVNQFLSVVPCPPADDTESSVHFINVDTELYNDSQVRGCCGDGDCAWAESSVNCPEDCPTAIDGSDTTVSELSLLEQFTGQLPNVSLATNGGECHVVSDKLPFCGRFIPFPIRASAEQAIQLDLAVKRKFDDVTSVIGGRRTGVASAADCSDAIAREYCLTAFEVCEGSQDLEYCWHTHPLSYNTSCGHAFACPTSTNTPVVCGPSPWGLLCVAEGGNPGWADLFLNNSATAAAFGNPSCEGLATRLNVSSPECLSSRNTACSEYKTESERCYNRAIQSTETGLTESFYAIGDNQMAQLLWSHSAESVSVATTSASTTMAAATESPSESSITRAPTPPTSATGCCVSFGYGARMQMCCFNFRDAVQATACTVPSSSLGGGMHFHAGAMCSDVSASYSTPLPETTLAANTPALDLALDGGRCQVTSARALPFCGKYVTYPTSLQTTELQHLDGTLRRKFEKIKSMVLDQAETLIGRPLDCVDALARELCMQEIPTCEGPEDLPYCWHARSDDAPDDCTRSFVCSDSTQTSPSPVVCGPGSPLRCVRVGGSPSVVPGVCAGLVAEDPDDIASSCETDRETACSNFGLTPGRCFERVTRPAPAGAPVDMVEDFVAKNGASGSAVLWTNAVPNKATTEDGGTGGFHPSPVTSNDNAKFYGPIVAFVATLTILGLLTFKYRQSRSQPVAYSEVGRLDDSSDDEDDFHRVTYTPDDDDEEEEAARIIAAARMKEAASPGNYVERASPPGTGKLRLD